MSYCHDDFRLSLCQMAESARLARMEIAFLAERLMDWRLIYA